MAIELANIGEELNLTIRQGATFGPYQFQMQDSEGDPIILTDCIIRGSIRATPDATEKVDVTAVITDAVQGEYELTILDTVTETMTAGNKMNDRESRYYWDLELMDAADKVIPLYHGIVRVFREITRA